MQDGIQKSIAESMVLGDAKVLENGQIVPQPDVLKGAGNP